MSEREAMQARLVATLSQTLRSERSARGWTQAEVESLMGITRNHYQLLESGLGSPGREANPRLSTLVAASDVLGVPLPRLLGTH